MKGEGPTDTVRKPKRFLPEIEPTVKEQFGQLGEKTIDKLLAGNIRSAVKAFCWDCMGGSKKDVALCESYSCPLWPHRPWKREEKKVFSLPVVSETEHLQTSEGSDRSIPSSGSLTDEKRE